MKAEEIRETLKTVMAERAGPITVKFGKMDLTFWIRKRTDAEYREVVELAAQAGNQAFDQFMATPALVQSARDVLGSMTHAQLCERIGHNAIVEFKARGLDVLDDLYPDQSESQEAKTEKLKERLKELLAEQMKEMQAKTHEELVDMLLTDRAKLYSGTVRVETYVDETVAQCVVGSDNERVFESLEDVRALAPGAGLDALQTEVMKFLRGEQERSQREVAESPDFPASTESA